MTTAVGVGITDLMNLDEHMTRLASSFSGGFGLCWSITANTSFIVVVVVVVVVRKFNSNYFARSGWTLVPSLWMLISRDSLFLRPRLFLAQ